MARPGGNVRVAIWGSCATRDAFELLGAGPEGAAPDGTGVEGAAAEDGGLELVYYGARSSWVCQAGRPLTPAPADLDGLTGFAARTVREDLTRQVVPNLVAARPDLVVFDLIDERLPLLQTARPTRWQTRRQAARRWVTASDYLDRTPLGQRLRAEGMALSHVSKPERAELFAAAVRRLAPRLTRALPGTVFVLNPSPYVTAFSDGGHLQEPAAGWARELQTAQEPLFDALAAAFGPRLVRLEPPAEVRLADRGHRWGPASYHLVPQFHRWLIDQLQALAAARARTPTAS